MPLQDHTQQDAKEVRGATASSDLFQQLCSNNEQINGLLQDLRSFLSRMTGHSLASPPQSESETVAPTGMLADIGRALAVQAFALGEMREATNELEKIA